MATDPGAGEDGNTEVGMLVLLACVTGKIEVEETAEDYDALCDTTAREPDEIALWSVEGATVSFVRMDGTIVPARTFEPDAAVTAAAGGDRIVVVGASYAEGDTTIVAFDRAGTEVWSHEEEGIYAVNVFVGDDGSVAWDRGWSAEEGRLPGALFAADGTLTELDATPVGAPVDGRVVTCDDTTCGWSGGSAWDAALGAVAFDGAMVMVDGADLRIESPVASRRIPLEGEDPQILDLEGTTALLRTSEGLWRWKAGSPTVEPIAFSPPSALRPFEDAEYCEAMPPALDGDGELLVALRDDAAGAVWRTDGTGWERVGTEVRDVIWLTGEATGATTVITATSANETYCPAIPWSTDRSASSGSRTEIVRGAFTFVLDRALGSPWEPLALSADGSCVLVPEASGGFAVLDVGTGVRSAISGRGGWLLDRASP